MRARWRTAAWLSVMGGLFVGGSVRPAAAGPQFVYIHNNSSAPGAAGRVVGIRMDREGRFGTPFSVLVPPGQPLFGNDTQSLSISPRLRILVAATGTSLTTIRFDDDHG